MKTMVASAGSHAAVAKYKNRAGHVVESAWADLDYDAVAGGHPWRAFPWYLGQRNYSGRYWSATERALVGYESRLELAHLLLADFDPEVKRIASQPFHLVARKSGRQFRRTPDYMLIKASGPVVVDVKPSGQLVKEDVRQLLELTRELVHARGWDYEIASEPDEVVFGNVRFLAGYRRDWLFAPGLLAEIRSAAAREPQQPIRSIINGISQPKPIAVAGLMHLLWRQELRVDLTETLRSTTPIEVAR
jgi:hypothetical protein